MLKKVEMKFKIGLFLFFNFLCANAQEYRSSPEMEQEKNTLVQWIGQFPEEGKISNESSFLDQISTIIFGKKDILSIIKPIALIANSPISFQILDQGSKTMFFIEDNEKHSSKAFKKSKIELPSLVGLCKFSDNNLLVTDSRLNSIFLINEDKKELVNLNNDLLLKQPTGIAFSAKTETIWVVETALHRISILNKNGQRIRTIGKRGNKPAEFNYPTAIWIGKNELVYVIDAMNFRVQVFDIDGAFVSVFGEAGDASGFFARPKGIATDTFGNIYVSDALFHTIQIFDIEGNFLYNFGEQGRGKGQFWMPSGIFIDDNNFIYIADSYNSRVQIFQLNRNE